MCIAGGLVVKFHYCDMYSSLSDKPTLFAKQLPPYQRSGIWCNCEVNTFVVVAAKVYGRIREGGLC